jgi:hypothetical protein
VALRRTAWSEHGMGMGMAWQVAMLKCAQKILLQFLENVHGDRTAVSIIRFL